MNSKIASMNIEKQLLRLFERDIVDSPELINNESFVGTYAQLKAQDMGVPIETLVDSDAFSELAQAIVDHNSNGEAGNSETSDCESRNMSSTAEEPQVGYVFKMSWFESARHTRSWTDMYFAQAEHTRWGFEPYGYPHCRISYVQVPVDSPEYTSAVENSEKASRRASGENKI